MNEFPKEFKTVPEAMAWALANARGRALNMIYLHAETCMKGATAPCTCEPECVLEELTVDNFQRAQAASRRWAGRHKKN